MSAYDTPTSSCPYCGTTCHAEWVDVGVGMVQCGPYRCDNCYAYEIGPEMEYGELKDENGHYAGLGRLMNPEKFTDKEIEIGWYEPSNEAQLTCIGCDKSPNELDEYLDAAMQNDMTPTDYVIQEEGTYNKFLIGKFYCTCCYIEAGQPLVKRS